MPSEIVEFFQAGKLQYLPKSWIFELCSNFRLTYFTMFDVATTINLYVVNECSAQKLTLNAIQRQYISHYENVKQYPIFEDCDSEGKGNFNRYPGICPEKSLGFNHYLRQNVTDRDILSHLKPAGGLLAVRLWADPPTPANVRSFLLYLRQIMTEDDKKRRVIELVPQWNRFSLELLQYLSLQSDMSPKPENADTGYSQALRRFNLKLNVPEECRGAISIITVFHRWHYEAARSSMDLQIAYLCGPLNYLLDKDRGWWTRGKEKKQALINGIHGAMVKRKRSDLSIWGKNCLPHAIFDSSSPEGQEHMKLELHIVTVANISRLGESVDNAVRNLEPHEEDKVSLSIHHKNPSLLDNPSSPGSTKKLAINDDLKQEWLEKYYFGDTGCPDDEWREAMKSLAKNVEQDNLYLKLPQAAAASIKDGWQRRSAAFFIYLCKRDKENLADSTLRDNIKLENQNAKQSQMMMPMKQKTENFDEVRAFQKVVHEFPFIPEVLYELVEEWLIATKLRIDPQTITDFMQKVNDYQEAKFPLHWINKFELKRVTNGQKLVLDSQNISLDLAEILDTYSGDNEQEDLGSVLRASGSHLTFAKWMMEQYRECRDAIRESLESHYIKTKNAIDIIAEALEREVQKGVSARQLILRDFTELLNIHTTQNINLTLVTNGEISGWLGKAKLGQQKDVYGPILEKVIADQFRDFDPHALSLIKELSKRYDETFFHSCLPDIEGVSKHVPYEWQSLDTAMNYQMARLVRGPRWIINGISTGSGKSTVICLLANALATKAEVWVITTNELLKAQLSQQYFGSNKRKFNITVFSAREAKLLMSVFREDLKPQEKYIIVDEFELPSNAFRMNLFYAIDRSKNEAKIYSIDSLSLFNEFKMVFGFCPHIPEIIKTKVKAIDNKAVFFNIGNMKGGGLEQKYHYQYFERTGNDPESMLEDTLDKVKYVLDLTPAPKCIFVIHAYKDDIPDLADEIIKLKVGHRKVMPFLDAENLKYAEDFLKNNRSHFSSNNGFIFVSYRGVIRGMDINGVEPSTMVINFEYASGFELKQTLGRGNRSQVFSNNAKAYILSNHIDHRELEDLINDQYNMSTRQNEQSDKLQKALHCLMIRLYPTQAVMEQSSPKPSVLLNEAQNSIAQIMGQESQSTYMWLVHRLLFSQQDLEKNFLMKGVAFHQFQEDVKIIQNWEQNPINTNQYPVRGCVWFNKQTEKYQSYLEATLQNCLKKVGTITTVILVLLRAQECNFPYLLEAQEFGTTILAKVLESIGEILKIEASKQDQVNKIGTDKQAQQVSSTVRNNSIAQTNGNDIHMADTSSIPQTTAYQTSNASQKTAQMIEESKQTTREKNGIFSFVVGKGSIDPLDTFYLAKILKEACKQLNCLIEGPFNPVFNGLDMDYE